MASAHSGSQHDRSVLLKHPLLLLLEARDAEPMDLEARLERSRFGGTTTTTICLTQHSSGVKVTGTKATTKRNERLQTVEMSHLLQVEFLQLVALCLLWFL